MNDPNHGLVAKENDIFQTHSSSYKIKEPKVFENTLNIKMDFLDYYEGCEPKYLLEKDTPNLLYNNYISKSEYQNISPTTFISMYFKEMNKSYFKNMKLPCIHKFIKRVSIENKKESTQ